MCDPSTPHVFPTGLILANDGLSTLTVTKAVILFPDAPADSLKDLTTVQWQGYAKDQPLATVVHRDGQAMKWFKLRALSSTKSLQGAGLSEDMSQDLAKKCLEQFLQELLSRIRSFYEMVRMGRTDRLRWEDARIDFASAFPA